MKKYTLLVIVTISILLLSVFGYTTYQKYRKDLEIVQQQKYLQSDEFKEWVKRQFKENPKLSGDRKYPLKDGWEDITRFYKQVDIYVNTDIISEPLVQIARVSQESLDATEKSNKYLSLFFVQLKQISTKDFDITSSYIGSISGDEVSTLQNYVKNTNIKNDHSKKYDIYIGDPLTPKEIAENLARKEEEIKEEEENKKKQEEFNNLSPKEKLIIIDKEITRINKVIEDWELHKIKISDFFTDEEYPIYINDKKNKDLPSLEDARQKVLKEIAENK